MKEGRRRTESIPIRMRNNGIDITPEGNASFIRNTEHLQKGKKETKKRRENQEENKGERSMSIEEE